MKTLLLAASEAASNLPKMDINYLLNFGAIGGVLFWFMTKFENRIKRLEEAWDRNTRATVIDIMSRPSASPTARAEAHKIAKELNARKGDAGTDTLLIELPENP